MLNYHVHTSSLIPSCNHNSLQVTSQSEFYQDIVSCKGWVGPHAVWFFIQVGFLPFRSSHTTCPVPSCASIDNAASVNVLETFRNFPYCFISSVVRKWMTALFVTCCTIRHHYENWLHPCHLGLLHGRRLPHAADLTNFSSCQLFLMKRKKWVTNFRVTYVHYWLYTWPSTTLSSART